MSDSKKREKERLSERDFEEMGEWLTTMPLSMQNPDKNLYYIADFITLAAHLRLPQNSRILEIGSGSCWPSEWLYRMGYRTVSSDISAGMLRLGRERFLPLARAKDNYALHAHFVCADAERLPFADGSFDGVVVFNAFHHFPSFAAALAEVHRVLADPGRFLLAEPGEGHSQTDKSIREMEEHGVMEQDVIIDEVGRLAEGIGFSGMEVILHRFPDMTLPWVDWKRFSKPWKSWRYKSLIVGDFVKRQKEKPCLLLKKGEGRPLDSHHPGVLDAALEAVEVPEKVEAGHPFRVSVRAENRGDTRWVSEGSFLRSGAMNRGEGGYVALGVKLLSEVGEAVDINFGRGPMAEDVPPGGEGTVTALLRAPEHTGRYRLKLDMVDEGIAWFEECGSKALEVGLEVVPSVTSPVFDSRFPDRLEATIELSEGELSGAPGESFTVNVAVFNRGNTFWRRVTPEDDPPAFNGGYVRLAWRLLDEDGTLVDLNYGRAFLPADLHPGEKAVLAAELTLPEKKGSYRVTFDLVDEGIAWFSERGSKPVFLKLTVE